MFSFNYNFILFHSSRNFSYNIKLSKFSIFIGIKFKTFTNHFDIKHSSFAFIAFFPTKKMIFFNERVFKFFLLFSEKPRHKFTITRQGIVYLPFLKFELMFI